MKLIYDASSSLLPMAGVGRYATELLRALIEQWPRDSPAPTVWVNSLRQRLGKRRHAFLREAARAKRVSLIHTRVPGPLLLECWGWLGWPAVEAMTGSGDVVHCPAAYVAPTRRAARVVTIHDLHYLRHPSHGAALGGGYLAATLPERLPEVEAVLVPSNAVRGEVLSHFTRVSPGQVYVVPEGVDADRFRPRGEEHVREVLHRRRIARPYILTVATLEPRKNLERLFKAMAAWRRKAGPNERIPLLVLVGHHGWGGVTVEHLCEISGLEPSAVRWLADAGDAELPGLYEGADAVAIPSLWEGFGLPALEAMACARPVVASRRGGLPEVVGDTGILIDPENIQELASALSGLLNGPEERRRELGARAAARARHFTWAAAARNTIDVYREAIARRRTGRHSFSL